MTPQQITMWGFAAMMFLVWVAMQWRGRLPTMQSIESLADVVNTRGGNILVLFICTFVFFFVGMRFIYWSAEMISEGKMTADNAVSLTGINWVTGTAFGGVLGAMLKTMTGESAKNGNGNGNGTTTTEKTVINSEVTKVVPPVEEKKDGNV